MCCMFDSLQKILWLLLYVQNELYSISGHKQAYLDFHPPPSLRKIVFIGPLGDGRMFFVGHPYL